MTSPHVSEQEVEAARAALRDQFDIWVAPISMRAALTAAAQVREINWKARAAEIRTDEGDELHEVYDTLGIGGNFSAIDEIKRLQAAAQVRKRVKMEAGKMQSMTCSKCGTPIQMQNMKPGDQFILNCPKCGHSISGGIGQNIKPDEGYRQPTEPDSGPDVLGEQKGEE